MTTDTRTLAPRVGAPRRPRTAWLVVTGLLLLSLVPVLAGSLRLTELAVGAAITPGNARFFAAPIPIVAHIVGSLLFSVLGAFQFVPALRRRAWHRIAGRVLIPAGLASSLSGLWMGALLPVTDAGSGILLALRLVVGLAMTASIVLAVVAIRRRAFREHGAWMTRAYALGVAAGTQAVVFAVWTVPFGPVDSAGNAALMGAAWMINAAIAEVVIARRGRGRP